MIGELVRKLFGVRNPDDLMRERAKIWEEWLLPIEPGRVGRDPGYEDSFLQIRDEVAKLSDSDDGVIAATAMQLLIEVGKDLRVAGYYAFARLHRDGPSGFADGLELVAALVDCYGEALLPVRPAAKRGALEWLASTRITDLITLGGGFSGDDLERALAAINALIVRTESWSDAARPSLYPLLACFKVEEETEATPQAGPYPSVAALTVSPVASSRDVLDRARIMAAYLRAQSHGYGYLSAARLIRCVRWDNLGEPPIANGHGQTRLPPPRPELRQQLKRMELQKQWPELLEKIESLFTESTSHFWFDLQYFQHVALTRAGPPYSGWADLFCRDLALTLQRLAGVERLQFSDGTPFADASTLEWIARSVTIPAGDAPAGRKSPAGDEGAADDSWAQIEIQARNLVADHGLDAAFAWLLGLGSLTSERQRYFQRRLMAELADQNGRSDMALHMLTQLDSRADELKLAIWEPDVVFDVKHHLLRLLRLSLNRKDADRPAIGRRIDALSGELTILDPARALAIGQ